MALQRNSAPLMQPADVLLRRTVLPAGADTAARGAQRSAVPVGVAFVLRGVASVRGLRASVPAPRSVFGAALRRSKQVASARRCERLAKQFGQIEPHGRGCVVEKIRLSEVTRLSRP